MKAQFGAIVVAGSGKVGGHVASRNRGGAYFRTRVTPVNPATTFQQAVRNRLTSFAQAWRALTDTQRAAWNAAVNDFARTDVFGNLRNPSGFNLYQRLNNNLAVIGQAAINVPPLVGEVYAAASLSLAAAVGTSSLTATFSAALAAGEYVKVFATPPLSPGKNFVKSEYRLIEVITNGDVSPYNFWTTYTAKFGAPVAGQKVFIKFVGVNGTTGQEGIGLEASAIVAA